MSIVLNRPSEGNTSWFTPVDSNWQMIQDALNSSPPQNILLNGGFDFSQRRLSVGATMTGNTSPGATTVTSLSSTANLRVGMSVTGSSIPAGRTIASIDSSTQVSLNSGSGVTSGTGVSLVFALQDDAYGHDRWYVLTETGGVFIDRTAGDTNSLHAGKLTQAISTSQRIGIAQIVEGINTIPLRSQSVCFQCRVKCSSSQPIRAALLEFTGSIDQVTSDVVQTWTSTDYSGGAGSGKFFLNSASLLVPVTPVTVTPTAGQWTDLSLAATLSSSANNVIVFVWTEGAAAQNVTLEITQAGLYVGSTPRGWFPRSIQQELALCQRYYEKSYGVDTDPGSTGSSGGVGAPGGWAMNTSVVLVARPFQVVKRTSPTMEIYAPSNGDLGKAEQASAGTLVGPGIIAYQQSSTGLRGIYASVSAVFTNGNPYIAHFTADSEL